MMSSKEGNERGGVLSPTNRDVTEESRDRAWLLVLSRERVILCVAKSRAVTGLPPLQPFFHLARKLPLQL
jgi:hypothetical protein